MVKLVGPCAGGTGLGGGGTACAGCGGGTDAGFGDGGWAARGLGGDDAVILFTRASISACDSKLLSIATSKYVHL